VEERAAQRASEARWKARPIAKEIRGSLCAGGLQIQPVSLETWATGPHASDPEPAMLVSAKRNRWSSEGQPTIYASSDAGVALAEYGRHRRQPATVTVAWEIELTLERAVDLRSFEARAALGIPDEATWVLDADRCQWLASTLRADGRVDGLLVPSVAFLDQPDRWNAVIFVDRLGAGLSKSIHIRQQAATILRGAAHHA